MSAFEIDSDVFRDIKQIEFLHQAVTLFFESIRAMRKRFKICSTCFLKWQCKQNTYELETLYSTWQASVLLKQ